MPVRPKEVKAAVSSSQSKGKEPAKPKVKVVPKTKLKEALAANKRPETSPFIGRPVFFASSSEQNLDKHKVFEAVSIHTAKCDGCEKHNTSVLQRCLICSHQLCRPCMIQDKNGIHPLRNDMDWVPSQLPHAAPRNAGRLSRGVTSGRITKKRRTGKIKSNYSVTPSDDESDSENAQKNPKERGIKETKTPPQTNSRETKRKRKRSAEDSDEGMFVGQSESEDDNDDDEYIPPSTVRLPGRKIHTREPRTKIRKTRSSQTIIETPSTTAEVEDEDEFGLGDIYNATPLPSPKPRRQNLPEAPAADTGPYQTSPHESISQGHDASSQSNAQNTVTLAAATTSRAPSSSLSSLASTPSLHDCAAKLGDAAKAWEGAEALLQISEGLSSP